MNNIIVNLPQTRHLIAKNNHKKGKLPKKIAIIYTEDKREYFSSDEDFLTVKGSYAAAKLFEPYFNKLHVDTCYIQADKNLAKNLLDLKPDMALNLVTTVRGDVYLGASVCATLEMMEIPYTGSSNQGFILGCNKYLTNCLLSQHKVPVPPFQLMTTSTTPLDPSLKFPLILKLNEEHSSLEITKKSIVETETELRHRLKYLLTKYHQPVLVSEFIIGREFAAYRFQTNKPRVIAVEKLFPDTKAKYNFLDFDLVWNTTDEEFDRLIPYKKHSDRTLTSIIKKTFIVAKMDDYAKFDIRMDVNGNYYVIDANCNCDFSPPEGSAGIAQALKTYHIPFELMLKSLLQTTMRKWDY